VFYPLIPSSSFSMYDVNLPIWLHILALLFLWVGFLTVPFLTIMSFIHKAFPT